MGRRKVEAVATKTATAWENLTALQAARQTTHDGDQPGTAELGPGKKEQWAVTDQLEQKVEDDPGEEEWTATTTVWENVTALRAARQTTHEGTNQETAELSRKRRTTPARRNGRRR